MRELKLRLVWLTIITIAIVTGTALAQLDPTFGTDGRFIRVVGGIEVPVKSFLLPDGKFLVLTENASDFNSPRTYHLVRFNSDGTTDMTYGASGSVQLPIPFISTTFLSYAINDAVRQPDGRVVVVGYDNSDGLMARFNENGTLDTSFSDDGIHRPNINQLDSDQLSRVMYQSDGRLIVAGHSTLNAVNRLLLIRYEGNGSLDTAFGNEGGFIVHPFTVVSITGLARQSSGSYIVLSRGWSGNPSLGKVYRFAVNGTHDASFTSPSFDEHDGAKLLVLADDRLLVGGSPYYPFDHLLRFHDDIKLTRLNSGGGLDVSFGVGGTVLIDAVSGMIDDFADFAVLSDGSIVVAGSPHIRRNRSTLSGRQMSMLKIDGSGNVTGRYLPSSLGEAGESGNLLVQPDGKLVVVATFAQTGTGDILLARQTGIPLTTTRIHGVPFEFSTFHGEPLGRSHAAIYRPTGNRWYATPYITAGPQFGIAGDLLASADYLGEFSTDFAVFRPDNGTWYIARGYEGIGGNFATIQWGLNGDIPAPYDFDGDGKADVTVFRPSDGNWYIKHSSDGSVRIQHWGANGDKPVAGDFDGDGLGDLAVWRPSSGVWYVYRSSDGQAYIVAFGLEGDVPVQEDYDGDLKTDIAVFRPSTGVWYIWRSSDGGYTIMPFGLSTDIPVPADYDADKKIDIAVYRPSTSRWYLFNSGSSTTLEFGWGTTGDVPVQGRY